MSNYPHSLALLFAMMTMFPASGCVSQRALPVTTLTVRVNDPVAANYSCFLEDGSLAVTTEAGVADDPALVKAPHFKPRTQYGPARLLAGDVARPVEANSARASRSSDAVKSFEEEVKERLAGSIQGLAYGAEQSIRLTAEFDDSMSKEARYLERRRTLQPLKTVKIMRQTVATQLGREPEPGMRIEENGSHFLEVVAVAGDTVVLRRLLHDGMSFMTPYGPARVVDDHAEHFTLIFDISDNMGVRTGARVGRVVGITDDKYLLDYGHPFGGAVLDCKVRMEQGADAERSISSTSGDDNNIHLQPEAGGANGKEAQADAK